MNKQHRIVWNAALSVWQCVAESAKGRSKGGGRLARASTLAGSALCLLAAGPAWAAEINRDTEVTDTTTHVYAADLYVPGGGVGGVGGVKPGTNDVTVTVRNGGVLDVNGFIELGHLGVAVSPSGGNSTKGTLKIEAGGRVQATNVQGNHHGPGARLHFNGGTLQIKGSQGGLLFKGLGQDNAGEVLIDAGGATIEVDGDVVTHDQARIHGTGSFTKKGGGTLLIAQGKAWDGDTTVDAGVLGFSRTSATGSDTLTFAPGHTLTIGVRGMNDYARLEAFSINLNNSKLHVDAAAAANTLSADGLLPDVIKANELDNGSLTGSFATVTDSSPLFDFEPVYVQEAKRHAVDLRVVAAPPPAPGGGCGANPAASVRCSVIAERTFAALGAADVLDAVRIQTPTSALALPFLPLTTTKQISDAANQSLPLLAGGAHRVVRDLAASSAQAIVQRQGALRVPSGGFGRREAGAQQDAALWLRPTGSWLRQDATDGAFGWKSRSKGLALGAEANWGADAQAGVALSYDDAQTDSRDDAPAQHSLKTRLWQITAYGNADVGPGVMDAYVGLGQARNTGERIIAFARRTAHVSYRSRSATAGLGYSMPQYLQAGTLTPFARLDYVRAKDRGYDESGADVFNLSVAPEKTHSLLWHAGLKWQQHIGSTLSYQVGTSVGYDSLDQRPVTLSTYEGAPNMSFLTRGAEAGRTVIEAHAVLAWRPTKNLEVSGHYQARWRPHWVQQNLGMRLKMAF